VFQRLEGHATAEGLWLVSTAANEGCLTSDSGEAQAEELTKERFRVVATAVKRQNPVTNWTENLSPTGTVEVADQVVRFIRSGLVEEYSASMDGVRQDFIIEPKPPGEGQLRLELAVSGAKVEPRAWGAQMVLEKCGRRIAYSRFKVTDAHAKELPARIELVDKSKIDNPKSEIGMAVVVEDAEAVYPIRVDPTFSDANWVSMGGSSGCRRSGFGRGGRWGGQPLHRRSFTAHSWDIYLANWMGPELRAPSPSGVLEVSGSAMGSGMNGDVLALVL